MGMKCSICAHEKRKEIDKALVAPNANFSAISRMFFGSTAQRDALRRHVERGHLVAKLAKAAAAQEMVESDDLLMEVGKSETKVDTIIESSMKSGDFEIAIKALRERRGQTELKARLLGLFKDSKPHSFSGKASGGTEIAQTVIYIPDNGRGPFAEQGA